ncbi:MAG: 1-pyrroline-5-carboxylate dehydrogenase [Elusimicrobia bacterium CG08_land_8_20_14_0_20_51_18]|nr:MAG: 1-pyrroline-5-carboxylate dehydrogenase [Elusimicrobia bacterium CG08_land_8_20_14_0_20_51_18]
MNTIFQVPKPQNEPILGYAPGTPEKKELKAKLAELKGQVLDIPLIIGGKEIRTGKTADVVIPHENKKIIARYHKATAKEVQLAADESRKAKKIWARMPWHQRASVFLKAAELLAGPWRQTLNAATMLGQSKNPFQAEIDSACELVDFYRFNTFYAEQIYNQQPYSPRPTWNYVNYRPLEGFIFAVTPFNFTSIAGNLPTAPAVMGNTVIWKPASTAVYSGYQLMKLWQAAGLPDGVINMVPGSGGEVGNPVLNNPDFMGLHFTGSTAVFKGMWSAIVKNLDNYRGYPRIVGETGGKDFIFAHESCDRKALITAIVRGSFEYQGQKCSAASRAYIPQSVWNAIKDELVDQIKSIKMGPAEDFTNFMNAVIDKSAFENIRTYLEFAGKSKDARILAGGECEDGEGYFIEPTLIQALQPDFKTMREEIFGPVMTVYVYEDGKYAETLELCDKTSPYALTGAIFAQDRLAIMQAEEALEQAAGNFYINDKPTGAVVSQQPFGGARSSGTNDKAGSFLNLVRWTSPRAVKENFVPPYDYKYPFMTEK